MNRRIFCLLLLLCFLLCGCGISWEQIKKPVTFTYLCRNYQEDLCCVIVSEEREASGHEDDLSYLLALYLMGPVNDELVSPLPADTRILSLVQSDKHLTIELSDLDRTLSDIRFSLAGACLTMTCLEITTATSVTVTSGSRSVTMDAQSLALFDSNAETQPEENPQ